MEGQSCFVSGPLAASMRLTRLVGLSPLRFEKQGNGWRASVSVGFSIYCHFLMTLSSFMILATLFMALKYEDLVSQHTWSRRVVAVVEIFVVIITTASMLHGAPRHMRRTVASLHRLQEINANLNVRQWPSEWTMKQIFLLISWMTLSWLLIVAEYASVITAIKLPEEQRWIKAILSLYYIYYGIIELGLMQFMLLVLHVRSTFKIINDTLKYMLHKNVKGTKLQQDMIQILVAAYVATCDVVRDVDGSYGVMLVILLASFFLHLVTTPYYFINDFLISSITARSESFVSVYLAYTNVGIQLFWCIFHAVNLMVLIEPCHMSHGEMASTGDLVSRLMVRSRSPYDPLVVDLEQFAVQLGLNHVTYKPLNIITLRRSLVLTIFGSIITYLVVLIDIK